MSSDELARAHGGAPLVAVVRSTPEDFQVIEHLGYGADGDGEHVLLEVRKRGLTTTQAAEALARFAGVAPLAVGYAGMKDRHAVTEQAFSVQLAGKPEPDWQALARDDLQVLNHARHRRKLKRGALRSNHFVLVLRDVQGDRATGEQVLEAIRSQGVPNYFGEQRFGRSGDNVDQARAMFSGRRVRRNQRSMLLSAARSQVFNAVLEQRVRGGTWNRALDGEIFSLAGSRSWFGPEPWTDELAARLERADIHPSGPLWGRGITPAGGEVAALEQAVADEYPDLVAGLIDAGMEQDRRALRMSIDSFEWHWPDPGTLRLSFTLPSGAYATSVVRELLDSRAVPVDPDQPG